ncbi:MAG: D-aminoacyl-tRNA deacylase [Bacillota bacterium]|nr:D-aminoacyl-tRNA deacylase [Bacillota bacterium]
MRLLVQRVREARVLVAGETVGAIGPGLLVFVGISHDDDEATVEAMWTKLHGLRIFEDEEGRTNLDLETVGGSLLLVSQFTLYADCRKGRRPSFTDAASPDRAEALCERLAELARATGVEVATGQFGARMEVRLINDGPFTIWLDSGEVLAGRRR